jgi:hypothetical protein
MQIINDFTQLKSRGGSLKWGDISPFEDTSIFGRLVQGAFMWAVALFDASPNLRVLLNDILPKNDTIDDYEIEHNFESIGQKTILLNACKIAAK